jgi:bacterioferritin-associated ferredoxin
VIVCQCAAVNDQRVVEEILSGACDVERVAEGCGAGARCGGCRPTIASLLVAFGPAEQPVA